MRGDKQLTVDGREVEHDAVIEERAPKPPETFTRSDVFAIGSYLAGWWGIADTQATILEDIDRAVRMSRG